MLPSLSRLILDVFGSGVHALVNYAASRFGCNSLYLEQADINLTSSANSTWQDVRQIVDKAQTQDGPTTGP